MGFPKLTNGRVLAFLDKASIALIGKDYLWDKMIPEIANLGKDMGKIPKYKPNMRVFSAKRGVWDESQHRMEWELDTPGSFDIQYYDLTNYIPDRIAEEFDSPFDAEKDSKTFLEQAMNIINEQAMASLFQNTTIITNNATPSVKWDVDTSEPIKEMEAACEVVRTKTGKRPNRAVFGAATISKFKSHPDFLNRISGVQTTLGEKTVIKILKDELELEEVYVGRNIYDSSQEGQTSTLADLWGDFVTLYYVPRVATLMTPSFAYRLKRKGAKAQKRLTVRRHAEDTGELYKIEWAQDDKVFEPDAAYLFENVLT